MKAKPLSVALYGVGAFGYALLKHLDRKQDGTFTLTAYDADKELLRSLREKRQHSYVQRNVRISDFTRFVQSPEELLKNADIVILAVSSDSTREVAAAIKSSAKNGIVIVNTAKALDHQTGNRLSEVIAEELKDFSYNYALLAGGTIAHDLFQHEPLGIDLACEDTSTRELLQKLFSSDNLHIYPTQDVLGTEYAAAFKNVIAILAGIVKGMGFSYGAETHVISKTAHLIAAACVQDLGAQPDTFSMGRQCWGNDLWMSCTGNTRNREFGILLGRGVSPDTALADMAREHKLVEGVNTLNILQHLAPIRTIKPVELLYELIITKTITVDELKSYLLNADYAAD